MKALTPSENKLLDNINGMTRDLNLNNVTRTKAYLAYYLRHPEVHWAFLGHMVSRNGGWNMTDLKGEFLTNLLAEKERDVFFRFLERGNWLIFQDVYPQLLLYEESVMTNKPLFYLLPRLKVSIFMEAIWNSFWRARDPHVLCIGLVINEQSYLEERVIQNPYYQKEVVAQSKFHLQDWLSINQILLPAEGNQLKGQTLYRFQSLHERILLGKRLYAVLFKNQEFNGQALEWAKRNPHTGSRKDYWPHLFNSVNEGVPGIPHPLRLKSCRIQNDAQRFYSPKLEDAWKNVTQPEAEPGDWFHDPRAADYLEDDLEPIDGAIKEAYCTTLERLEIAALAKKAIHFID
nr:DUF2515 family protein [Paenibacillus sp. UNC496MF]